MSIPRARDALAQIESEVCRLRQKLTEAEGKAIKLRHYIEIASEYESSEAVPLVGNGRARMTSHEAVIEEAEAELRTLGRRMPTRRLAELLQARGVQLPGRDQIQTLSSYLSRSKEKFTSDRREGWGLVEWGHGQPALAVTRDEIDTGGANGDSAEHIDSSS